MNLNSQGINLLVITAATESGYSHQDTSLKVLKEHNSHDTSVFESLYVGICLNNIKNVVVGVIYRSPSENKLTLLETFNKLFSKLSRNEKICYISGDFNLAYCNFKVALLRHSL